MFWVGDADEESGPFADGLAVEVDATMFCDYPLDKGSWCDDSSTWGECWDNFGGAFGGGGGHGDDGYAAFAVGGANHEVELTAASGKDFGADGVGTDLAGEVDFNGGV